jgi:hypothetical protein
MISRICSVSPIRAKIRAPAASVLGGSPSSLTRRKFRPAAAVRFSHSLGPGFCQLEDVDVAVVIEIGAHDAPSRSGSGESQRIRFSVYVPASFITNALLGSES